MANVTVFQSFTVQDADGEKASIRLWEQVADTTTLATLGLTLSSLAILIDACLDGKVIKYGGGISNPTQGIGVKADPVAGSEIERVGAVTCDLVALSDVDTVFFPAFRADLFSANSILLDDTDLKAVTDIICAAPYLNRFEVIKGGNVLDGVKVFRKHRKQTKRARGVTS
jgi:hypothetical protein